MNYVLLGAPGSGKGTLSENLKKKENLLHVSTGDILRKEVQKASSLGLRIKDIIQAGELVSDDIMIELIKNETKDLKNHSGFILDGFPRTLPQAKNLNSMIHIDKVIYLNIDPQILIDRLVNRRTCSKCSSIFNTLFKPPKKENICDECGGELIFRGDDQDESSIVSRFENFKKNSEVLIELYQQKNVLIELDGAKTFDEIYKHLTHSM